MKLTIITQKQPYIFLDIEEFSVEAEEGLSADVETKNNVTIYRFSDNDEALS